MRKFVLAIVIALFGVVIVGPRSTTANGSPTIAVSYNNSRSVQVVIQRDDTQAQYILICAINATECTPENASDSTKVVRFDCHVVVGTQHNPHGCRTYDESAGDH